jgi:hypothetical protein
MKKDAFFDFFKLMKPDMQDIMKQPRYSISVLIAGLFLFISAGSAWSEQNERADEYFTTFLKEKHSIWFRGITATEDGHVAVGGITKMGEGAEPNGFVVKIDKSGNIKWEKELGNQPRGSFFNKVAATKDNKAILVGMHNYVRKPEWQAGSYSASSGWVVKLAADGTAEWDKALQITEKAHFKGADIVVMPVITASDISPMKDGDVIVLGNMRHGIFDTPMIWRMDEKGTVLWEKTLKRDDSIWPHVILSLSEKEFLACSSAISRKAKGTRAWMVNFDDQGHVIWEKKLKGERCEALTLFKDGIILAGSSGGWVDGRTGEKSATHFWLSRVTRDGRVKWWKHVKARGLCGITNLWEFSPDQIAVIGRTCETERERIWAGFFSTSGEMLSQRKYLVEREMKLDFALPDGRDGFVAIVSGAKHGENSYAAGILKTRYDSDKYK